MDKKSKLTVAVALIGSAATIASSLITSNVKDGEVQKTIEQTIKQSGIEINVQDTGSALNELMNKYVDEVKQNADLKAQIDLINLKYEKIIKSQPNSDSVLKDDNSDSKNTANEQNVLLMDVCPPYELSYGCHSYSKNESEYFVMAGKKFSDGFILSYELVGNEYGYALINLDEKYEEITFTIGHVDGTFMHSRDLVISLDGEPLLEETLSPEMGYLEKTLPLKKAKQIKFRVSMPPNSGTTSNSAYGFANIILR